MQTVNIFFLEDHRLSLLGVRYFLLHTQKNYEIECFNHPDNALVFIEDFFSSGKRIDLIITDFIQRAGNGYRFASTGEGFASQARTPYAHSACKHSGNYIRTEIYKGLMTEVVDRYLPRSTSIEEILTVVWFLAKTNARG